MRCSRRASSRVAGCFPRRATATLSDDLPSIGRSPSVAAKVVLDEIFFMSEVLLARFVTAADRDRLAGRDQRRARVLRRRGMARRSARVFRAPPALEPRALTEASSFGRTYRHLTFASEYEPRPGEPGGERWHARTANRTAHAWLLQHPGPPRPWLVCLHGYRTGSPLTGFFQFSPRWLHESLGVNLVLPVLPLHGPRSSGWRSGDGLFSGEILDMVHLQAQAIWDLRRLLAGCVPRRHAGRALRPLARWRDRRAHRRARAGPRVRHRRHADGRRDGPGHRHVPPSSSGFAERFGISFDEIARLLRVVSPFALAPRVPADRLFIFGGPADRLVPSGQVSALWNHWGQPRIEWHGGSHTSFGIESRVNLLVSEALAQTRMAAA